VGLAPMAYRVAVATRKPGNCLRLVPSRCARV
jgi:hypothetical protein